MISFEKAYEKAKDLVDFEIREYSEFNDAYIFSPGAAAMSFGGDESPIVILKKTGRPINMLYYLDEVSTGSYDETIVGKYELKDGKWESIPLDLDEDE